MGASTLRADQALQLLDHLLWTTFLVAAPLLISCLVVGLLISVLQVATQLQEMTLSYVPKLAVAALVLVALGPWMIQQIMEFAIGVIKLIPSLS
jgi:flagellar biosynthetic protein FliQ